MVLQLLNSLSWLQTLGEVVQGPHIMVAQEKLVWEGEGSAHSLDARTAISELNLFLKVFFYMLESPARGTTHQPHCTKSN